MSSDSASRLAVLIPARLASTRLARKVLVPIHGRSMLQWVYDAARRADAVDSVFIVSGDSEIHRHCLDVNMAFIRSVEKHVSGTDRIAEAASLCPHTHFINVQGDEPCIEPEVITAVAHAVLRNDADMVTVGYPLSDAADRENQNRVKIEVDVEGCALNFCRSWAPAVSTTKPWVHLGIYGFGRRRLLDFAALPHTQRSQIESLEQLRALEAGWTIRVLQTDWRSTGVDTAEDLNQARARLA